MVDLFQSSTRNMFTTAVWVVKLGFLFIGFVSTVLLLKHSVPYSVNAVFSSIPQLWISFRCWLAPPYVYIVVNFIIIIIAASSRFQHKNWWKNSEEAVVGAEKEKPSDLGSDHQKTSTEIWPELEEIPVESVEKALVSIEKSSVTRSDISCLTESDEKKIPARSVSSNFAAGKKLKTCRVIKSAAPPQKAAKAPENDDDTLDATWKMITEGKGKPLSRQLKKSETWDVSPRVDDPESELDSLAGVTNRKELRKLETFKDGSSASAALMRAGCGGLTRDVSLSQDELNYRAEAFIKKFKLQRQESDHRYMRMVNRGVY